MKKSFDIVLIESFHDIPTMKWKITTGIRIIAIILIPVLERRHKNVAWTSRKSMEVNMIGQWPFEAVRKKLKAL